MKSKLTAQDRDTLSEALFDSVQDGQSVPLIAALLHAGADPNTGRKWMVVEGITPLMVASSVHYVSEESQKLIDAFVAAGANLTAKDSGGMTPVAYARANCNDKFAEQLKQAKRLKK